MIKIIALYGFPVSYTSGLFKTLASEADISLRVLYCKNIDSGSADRRPLFLEGDDLSKIRWLEGFDYYFLEDKYNKQKPEQYYMYNPEVRRFIRPELADVLIIGCGYWTPTIWMAIKEAQKYNIPIITRMTVEGNKKRNIFLRGIKRIVVGEFCKAMSAGVYETENQKAYFQSYGMDSSKMFFGPCAVDNDYFQEQAKKFDSEETRKRLGIDKDDFVVSFLGNFIKRKRVIDIVYAMQIINKELDNIHLVLIGDGEERSKIEGYVKSEGIDNVHFTGILSNGEIGKILVAANVFVLPSSHDASSKALNEAMNFSLPIVVSDGVETASELLVEGENGFQFHVGDVEGLAAVLINMSTDRNKTKIMGKKSLDIVNHSGYDQKVVAIRKAIDFALIHKDNLR